MTALEKKLPCQWAGNMHTKHYQHFLIILHSPIDCCCIHNLRYSYLDISQKSLKKPASVLPSQHWHPSSDFPFFIDFWFTQTYTWATKMKSSVCVSQGCLSLAFFYLKGPFRAVEKNSLTGPLRGHRFRRKSNQDATLSVEMSARKELMPHVGCHESN